MSDQKIKADEGKPKLSLVPWQIVYDIARVREYGNRKYGNTESWREVGPERYIDALLRHTLAFASDPFGRDEESGLPHLWHVATNVAFLSEKLNELYRAPEKDRVPTKRVQGMIFCGKEEGQRSGRMFPAQGNGASAVCPNDELTKVEKEKGAIG